MTTTINDGEVVRENKDRLKLRHGSTFLNLGKQVRDKKGHVIDTRNWVLSISKNKKKGTSPRGTLTTPSSNPETDGVILPPSETPLFYGKDTNKLVKTKTNAEKFKGDGENLYSYSPCS